MPNASTRRITTNTVIPSSLLGLLQRQAWSQARAWLHDHPHQGSHAVGAALLNWASGRHAIGALPLVWGMAPEALNGVEWFWNQVTPSAMRWALQHDATLQDWARRQGSSSRR